MDLKLRIPPPSKKMLRKLKDNSKPGGNLIKYFYPEYKEFSHLSKKTNNLKISKRFEQPLHQRNYTAINKNMKKSSMLLDTREILIITTTYFL